MKNLLIMLALLAPASTTLAVQDATDPPAGTTAAAAETPAAETGTPTSAAEDAPPAGFGSVPGAAEARLEATLEELRALRRRIADESIGLNRRLNELQTEYEGLQDEYRKTARLRDSRALDLGNLTREINGRKEQGIYLSNQLAQYVRNWGARLPISELQRYREVIEEAEVAPENETLSDEQVYRTLAEVVSTSIEHLDDALGGTRFEGQALDASGTVRNGTFVLVGPAQFFRAADGSAVGPVEQQLNSQEPSVVSYTTPQQTTAAEIVINNGRGDMPMDPTLGNARIIEQTSETITEHLLKGGPVVWPILTLAGAAVLTALFKWIGLSTIPNPKPKRLDALLAAVKEGRKEGAIEAARAIPGPTGRMLVAATEHLREPKELIEEIMYEKVLATRLVVQRFLPFIAISAAAAPLLGLLGTVTGIIGTFKMITLFGTGDVKTLSGGISEALITTELGLVAAIPALLLHAFLSRKAKGITDRMEQAGLAFINQVSISMPSPEDQRSSGSSRDGGDTRREAREALADLLSPILDERRGPSPAESGA